MELLLGSLLVARSPILRFENGAHRHLRSTAELHCFIVRR
jgi:hypothetical protein